MDSSQIVAKTWYGSPEAFSLFNFTDHGKMMFVWQAILNDGSVLRQFEDHTWELLITNPDIPIPFENKLSTDVIPRDKVVQFTLYPIARTRTVCPWFDNEVFYSVSVDPAKEELLAYWLVDHHVVGGPGISHISRQVFGVRDRDTGKRNLTVVCPSGKVYENLPNDDMSFEGE